MPSFHFSLECVWVSSVPWNENSIVSEAEYDRCISIVDSLIYKTASRVSAYIFDLLGKRL